MKKIRNFCNNSNPGAGSGGTKRKASTSLTPVAKRISNSLGSNLDTPEQIAKSNTDVAPTPPTPASTPALSVLPNILAVTDSELQSPPGLLKNIKKGVSSFIAGLENEVTEEE